MIDLIETESGSSSAAFFERMYRRNPDPWNFAVDEYEQARYRATMTALGDRSYGRAFEPGCSVGVLTDRLAGICESVEAIDISSTAVEQARERCRCHANVRISTATVAEYTPTAALDLVVLSEIGYYFSSDDLRIVSARLIDGLQRNGTLLAVHWLGSSADHLLSGDEVHEILLNSQGLTHELSERHRGFRLDRWRRS